MGNPGRGKPYSIRTLAEASGVNRNTVEKLANGTQKSADVGDAHSLVEALGVTVLVLFMPASSPELDDSYLASPPTKKE
ncbi:helix-turn-helix domain-containing protein [Streptomyces olivaceus]|uniref:helix-turn-helix domain-containing protein n=1 Tax=Streptomyces olivaceus TaxID=47716 RepID=UPI001CCB2D05|nr:helix-turn-helix domain-containing protein [Streptomyces olivaceus]MBZ6290323.1 helix-turn-helix domain-containing protein [Streptomyces olivaceus]MBZ6324275.1 helix-turn-helix domain-containing protein [Streptomyces olivaceus]